MVNTISAPGVRDRTHRRAIYPCEMRKLYHYSSVEGSFRHIDDTAGVGTQMWLELTLSRGFRAWLCSFDTGCHTEKQAGGSVEHWKSEAVEHMMCCDVCRVHNDFPQSGDYSWARHS